LDFNLHDIYESVEYDTRLKFQRHRK